MDFVCVYRGASARVPRGVFAALRAARRGGGRHVDLRKSTDAKVPIGTTESSPRFQPWVASGEWPEPRRGDRKDGTGPVRSSVPDGTRFMFAPQPSDKSLGYLEALVLAQSLQDNFAGKNAPPHQLARAMDISPTSSRWQSLSGAAVAYGLTDGAYSANDISLTPLGRRIVATEIDGDDVKAKLEAALKPGIMRKFFTRYNPPASPGNPSPPVS